MNLWYRRNFVRIAVAACAVGACSSDSVVSQAQLEKCGRNRATCGNGPMYVLSRLTPSYPDAQGRVAGFNIDGLVSDAEQKEGCRVADFVAPDGTPGIDNRFVDLLESTSDQIKEYVPAVLQSTIGTGGFLFIVEMVGVDDFENDDEIGLVIRRSTDLPLLGTDGELLDGQTFNLAFDHFAGATINARIENGRILAGPLEWKVLTHFFAVDIRFNFKNVYVDATFSPERNMISGVMGGSIPIADILGIADAIENFGGDASVPIIRALVPPLADVQSPDTGDCDQLSFAIFAEGKFAFVHDEVALAEDTAELTGDQLFVQLGCIECHTVTSVPGAVGTIGPPLDGLGARSQRVSGQQVGRDFVVQSLNNPNFTIADGYEPDIMPDDTLQRLTLEQYDVLVDWLMTL